MDKATENRAALARIEQRAHAARLTITELCREAGVAYTTLYRAKGREEVIKIATLLKLESELDAIESRRAAPDPAQDSAAPNVS